MEVKLSKSGSKKSLLINVSSWDVASIAVQIYIQDHNLGSGCSDDSEAFTGGEVYENGKKIGRISYNGRAWDLDGKEIAL